MLKKAWGYIYLFLFSFYVLGLTSSTAAIETFSGLIVIVTAIKILSSYFKTKTWPSLRLGNEFWLLGFCAAVIITALLSPTLNTLSYKLAALSWLRWVLILYSFYYVLSEYQHQLSRFIKPISILFGIIGLYGIIQHFTGLDILRDNLAERHKIGEFYRIRGLMGITVAYSFTVGMMAFLPLTHVILQKLKNNKVDKTILISTVFIWVSLFLTYTRGLWLSLIVALLFMVFMLKIRVNKKALAGILVCLVGVLFVSSNMLSRVKSITDLKANNGRIKLLRGHWEIAKERPVLGHGLRYHYHVNKVQAAYDKLGIQKGEILGPHNVYLDVFAGSGIFGLLFYLGFVISLFKISLNLLKEALAKEHWVACSFIFTGVTAQILMQVGGLIDSLFLDLKIQHMFLFILGLMFAARKMVQESEDNNKAI